MIAPDFPLRLNLDFDALVSNWRALDRLSGKARAGAAVKADAYGLGAQRVVPALASAGCRDFFVAYASEAVPLAGLVAPELVAILHGPQNGAEASCIRARGFVPVINSLHQAQLWMEAGGGPCDVMVDTGINRLGLSGEQLDTSVIRQLDVRTVHSHLACAEVPDAMNDLQLGRWQNACRLFPGKVHSLANSAGIMLGEEYHGHLTRPGIALYGGVPTAALAADIRQVAYPQAAIMQIRTVRAGEAIGYNATYRATRDLRVAVVGVGYADGYLRCWSNLGTVAASGAMLPVLGRVSMDMTVIDLTAAPELSEGDWVTLDYHLPAAALRSGLSQYELLTLLGRRFAR